jgi:hypothetical protein
MDRRATIVKFEFVDNIPQSLPAEGTIYISIPRRTTAHLGLGGCGEKVVHPLRPHRWSLSYDGETISMSPSIGNSGLACKSHYWIKNSHIDWWPPLTDREIALGLTRDGWGERQTTATESREQPTARPKIPWWRRFLRSGGR